MIPPIERSEHRLFVSGGSLILASDLSLDWRPLDEISIGVTGLSVLAGPARTFVAARIGHRLWQGPGGTALGHVWSVGRLDVDGWRGGGATTEVVLQPALAATIPAWFLADPQAVKLRLTYGPAIAIARSGWTSAALPEAGQPGADFEWYPRTPWAWTYPQLILDWMPNLEVAVRMAPSWELTVGGGPFIGGRMAW